MRPPSSTTCKLLRRSRSCVGVPAIDPWEISQPQILDPCVVIALSPLLVTTKSICGHRTPNRPTNRGLRYLDHLGGVGLDLMLPGFAPHYKTFNASR